MIYIDKPANNILLIDINVLDYQQVVNSVNSDTLAIVYDYTDTYEDLSNILQNYHISRVGIFFELNKPFLNGSFFETKKSMIEIINYHTIPQIDYLACNTLNYPEWVNYYKELPCVIGASNNETGNIEYGGDWIMESTGENIEFIYFNDIEYKHLLGPEPNYILSTSKGLIGPSVSTYGLVVMKNTTTTAIIVHGGGVGSSFFSVKKYSSIDPDLPNVTGYTIHSGGTRDGGSMAKYVSSNKCPTLANSSNDYLIYTLSGLSNVYTMYNIVSPTVAAAAPTEVASTKGILFNTGNNFAVQHGITIYKPYLYYSTSLNTIGRATITDSTGVGTSIPTCSIFDNNYISTTNLSSSSTYYPTELTTDSTGNLYIVMGNITATPPTLNIIIYNVNNSSKSIIDFSSVFNPMIYGYYRSIAWYNDILYIGTSIGVWTTSVSGYVIGYNTSKSLLQVYTKIPSGCPSNLTVYVDASNSTLLSKSLLSITNNIVITYIFNPLNTMSGIYKKNYNNTSYNVDAVSLSKYLANNYVQHSMGGQLNLPVGQRNVAALAVMNNTSSTTVMVMWQQLNNTSGNKRLFVMNYSSSIANLTNFGYQSSSSGSNPLGNTMVIYTSPFNCPTIPNPSKDYLIFTKTDTPAIHMLYNIGSPPASGFAAVASTESLLINLGTGILNSNSSITNYQNFLYYSTASFTIGRATIIEPTADGVIPTCTIFDNNYISTTDLSSSSTYYPTQLTTDTSGNLYIVMANITTLSITTSNIIIMNPITKIKRTISFYDVFNPIIYGYYRSIAWCNNILYIGTSVGSWTSSSSGYIIAYDMQKQFLQIYIKNPNGCPSALTIYNGTSPALLSTNLLMTTTNYTSINVITPINITSGFYKKKYNNTTHIVDITTI
jgi:hypothetical protein